MRRVWELHETDPGQVAAVAAALDLPEILARLLLNRKLHTPEESRRFLEPSLSDLHDPSLMKGMQTAVERTLDAIKEREPICVFGDYDVDGVTSVSLLLLFLRQVGLQVDYYIPSRVQEGYGLSESALDAVAARGCKLLITVDCGISDVEQVDYALSLGMDVIIIDHHQVPDELPRARAILNPLQPECAFPAKNLAAVGVTFNLIIALRAELRRLGWFSTREEPNLRDLLDLVSLGTVADIVPLLDENRVITHFGLAELSSGRRPGVAALKEVSGILAEKVAVGQVAFRLAPRINAVGRLGLASQAVELLTTRSYSSALRLARELDKANGERQAIEQKIFEQAMEMAHEANERGPLHGLVLHSESWHVGVVGSVASRLTDRFGCPVVLIALDGEKGRGSARGTEQVHLYHAIEKCSMHLEAFGGHRAAAGLSIRRQNVDGFRECFLESIAGQTAGEPVRQTIWIDAEAAPSSFDTFLMEQLAKMAPHGLGNPEPVFLARNLEVKSARTVGREPPYHLKAVVIDNDRKWDVIGFSMGDRLQQASGRLDILFTPEYNTWEGFTNIQLKLRDFRPSEPA